MIRSDRDRTRDERRFVGNGNVAPEDVISASIDRWSPSHGDIVPVSTEHGPSGAWLLNHPNAIRHVLFGNHRNYTKGPGLERVKLLLGNGIMVSEGAHWHRQRRMIQPAFRPAVMRNFTPMIREENLALAELWSQYAAAGATLEMTQATSELSLRIILNALFGCDLHDLQRNGSHPFALLCEETERNLRFAARFHALRGTVADIVEARRRQRRDEADILGVLMRARAREDGAPMSDRQLLDEVMTLIVAGHETTASSMAWIWYLLATHPAIADALAEETAALEPESLEAEDVEALTLPLQIIQESMRLYPPGWLLSRRAIDADDLCGHEIAPGSDLFISPYLIQRHPRYWSEPARFKPERFAEPPHRFTYIPFAAGPRNCIGEPLAMTEMLLHLGVMARRFRAEYAADRPPEMAFKINLRPSSGIPVRLSPR